MNDDALTCLMLVSNEKSSMGRTAELIKCAIAYLISVQCCVMMLYLHYAMYCTCSSIYE